MNLVRNELAVNWVWHTGDRKRPLNEGQTHTFSRRKCNPRYGLRSCERKREGGRPRAPCNVVRRKARGVGFYQQVLEDAHVQRLLRRGGLLHLEVQLRHDVLDPVLGVNALLGTVEMKQAAEMRSIWGESPVVS